MNLNKMIEAASNLEIALSHMKVLIECEKYRQDFNKDKVFPAEPEIWGYYADRIKKLIPQDIPEWPESNAHDLGVFTVVPPTLERFQNSY